MTYSTDLCIEDRLRLLLKTLAIDSAIGWLHRLMPALDPTALYALYLALIRTPTFARGNAMKPKTWARKGKRHSITVSCAEICLIGP